MRDYAKVAPLFWTRGSGKKLRGDPEAQVLALYLVTCPSANMVGIYYVPFVSVAHETGLEADRTRAAMSRLAESGFAFYDEEAELAWVPNMASYQLGDEISPKDNRHKGILAELQRVAGHEFVDRFYGRYAEAYSLPPRRGSSVAKESLTSPLQAPPKGPEPHGEEKRREGEESEREGMQGEGFALAPADEQGSKTRLRTVRPKVGSRLSADWALSDRLAAWAKGKGIAERDVAGIAERFRDHWLASTLPSALKADWDAAFRTWAGRDIEGGRVQAVMPRAPEPAIEPRTPAQLKQIHDGQAVLAAAMAEMKARNGTNP